MPNLLDPTARQAIRSRVERLAASSQPKWGRMNVGQMVVHCGLQLKLALGDLKTQPMKHPAGRFPLKQLILYVLPTPRSVPTLPELRDPLTGDWEQDRRELDLLIERFGQVDHAQRMPDHAFFGALTTTQWGLLAWKHLDHHLRQFGA